MKLYIFFLIATVHTQEVAIKQVDGVTQFLYNSSDTHVATFIFDFCIIVSFPPFEWQCNVYRRPLVVPGTIYIHVTQAMIVTTGNLWAGIQVMTGDIGHRVP